MKRFLAFMVLALVAACAPGVSSTERANEFVMVVDDQTVRPVEGAFIYTADLYRISLIPTEDSFLYILRNTSNQMMALSFDNSVIVTPSGLTSRTVPGTASWATRNDPQPNEVIPSNAMVTGSLIPVQSLGFASGSGQGTYINPMFRSPLKNPVDMRLILSLDIGDTQRQVDFLFRGTPRNATQAAPQPAPAPATVSQPAQTASPGGGYTCATFESQGVAQAFFIASGGPEQDPYNLDPDKNGRACEELPTTR